VSSIIRGAPAEARPTAWTSVADGHADVRLIARRESACGFLELRRSHVVRRRVDQVARQRHRRDDAREILAIDALRRIELDRASFRLTVAREAVAAEREGERRQPRVMRIVGEAKDAG
jgi:hypothetical protein